MMTTRKAEPGDFLAIAALDRESWKQNSYPEFIPDGEHVWRVWVEHALVYCTEEEGQIVGAILAFPGMKNVYCLHKVFVSEHHRGKGIARQLMSSLLQEIDRLKADIFLTVDPDNRVAMNLYDKMGFTDRDYVKGYYRDDEHRFVLTRESSV